MKVNFLYILLIYLIAPNFLFGSELDDFVQVVRENRSTISVALKKYRVQEEQKKKNPFYRLGETTESQNTLAANLVNKTLTSKDEDYLLRDHRKNVGNKIPAPNAPEIDSLTKQVNKILQNLSNAPQVYELEAMYVMRKSFTQSDLDTKDCIRKNLGVEVYTQSYKYDPAAMFLLASENKDIASIQVIKKNKGNEHIYYYRGVLDRKDLIVQVVVKDDLDEATINILSLTALKKSQKSLEGPRLADDKLNKTKGKYKKWGKLYGGQYKKGDFSVKGGLGLEYKYDKHNLPRNLRIWSLETGYQTENFNLGLESTLDTKKQEIRAKISKKSSSGNSFELFLKGENPGIEIKTDLALSDYSLKGSSKYYKKIVSGSYKFDEPSKVLTFNAGYSVDQKTKSESYELSKDLYRNIKKDESTVINVKLKRENNSVHNQNSVWLGFNHRF